MKARPLGAEEAPGALRGLVPPSTTLVVPALVLILALGAGLRLAWPNWDDGAHLHPDERYLSTVAEDVSWPRGVRQYFDVEHSPLSPYSTEAGASYLYGQLPLVATKLVATILGRDSYGRLYLVGRTFSGLLDTLSILLVFLVARLLLRDVGPRPAAAGALLAATFYALSVTAIQHAHFFTTESWLVVLTLAAFYAAAHVARADSPGLPAVAAVGVAVGLTVSAKVSGATILVPVALALVAAAARLDVTLAVRAKRLAGWSLGAFFAGYVSFRLTSPYAFESSSWLSLEPSNRLRAALEAQASALDGEFLYPPAYQWLLSRPVIDPLWDELAWGLGVPLGLTALAGIGWLAYGVAAHLARAVRVRADVRVFAAPAVVPAMLLAYVLVTFAYFGTRFVHSIRYLLPIVPFLCIAAALAVVALHRRTALVGLVAGVAVGAASLVYAVGFVQIYGAQNTRLEATAWIDQNVEPGSSIVSEHWDDALPVRSEPGRYLMSQLPVFDPDDETKLRKLYDGLAGADIYALSSPRAWRTVGRLPERFPIMARFYRLLAEGRLGFGEAARFTSGPRLLGREVSDLTAEETFWVYDHPPVILYRRLDRPSWPQFRAVLCGRAADLPGCADADPEAA